ncbi:MAG: T9SS type A sorting domain-containing protein [Bacteroidetes bacterium]|nr:T9SS type A sorting domain-containing protein [Bacteroidota bacterium]
MKKITTPFLLSAGLLLSTLNINAQAPSVQWQNTLGSTSYEFLNTIDQTSDGGYIMGGYTDSNIGGDKSENSWGVEDYWIVKMDNAGNIVWENTVGGGNYDKLYAVEETPDGGYIVGGQSLSGGGWGDKSESNKGGYDYWIVKLDEDGVVEWDRSYGGLGNDQLYNVQPTSDGGYIIAGTSDSGISGDKTENRVGNSDYWVIKTDASGNIIWQNDIGGLMFDNVYSAYETADGGYILGGTSTSGISGDKTAGNYGVVDYWIVKLNSAGTVVWDKTIGGTLNDYLYAVIPTADGGSIACGMSESGLTGNKTDNTNGLYDYWVVKLDNSGNITWQNSIGGTGNDYAFVNAIDQTSDGGYAIAGYSQSLISGDKTEANTGSWDYWILKINSTGSILWQTVLGGVSGDYANAISATTDGGFIVGGFSYSSAGGDKDEDAIGDADFWIIRLAGDCVPAEEICNDIDDDCDGIIDDNNLDIDITVYSGTTFCQGGSVTMEAFHNGTSLQWKKNGANIPGANSALYTANKAGVYTCVTTGLCSTEESIGTTVTVNKNPKAVITAGGPTTFCAGGSVTLSVTPVAGGMYQWFQGPSAIAGETGLNYVATTSGNFKCRVTKAATGCVKMSTPIPVSVTCKEGEFVENNMQVYPNPASTVVTISTLNNNEKTIHLIDALGSVIATQITTENVLQMNIEQLPAGVYFVQIVENGIITSNNFIKQ